MKTNKAVLSLWHTLPNQIQNNIATNSNVVEKPKIFLKKLKYF